MGESRWGGSENDQKTPRICAPEPQQIVTKKADIFSNKQKAEFKIVNLIENTRQLLSEEIIHHMYPSEVLSTISEDIGTEEASNTFISYSLQKAFLPWPISLIHFVPDWLILTIIGIIGLLLFGLF